MSPGGTWERSRTIWVFERGIHMTWKKAILRGFMGAPIGVTISYAITIVTALAFGGGQFSPVVPAMAEAMGSEINAVTLQFGLTALMGFVFALASCIWEVEQWGILIQTLLHFCTIAPVTLFIAWVCHWADYTPGGLWGYFGIFAVIYTVIYIAVTLSARAKIRRANQKLSGR